MAYTTIASGVRDLIVQTGLVGRRVYRNEAPTATELPHCVLIDELSVETALAGDGVVLFQNRSMEIELYQAPDGSRDPRVATQIAQALRNQRFEVTGYGQVYVGAISISWEPQEGYYKQIIEIQARQPAFCP